jgi:hypothetical protein
MRSDREGRFTLHHLSPEGEWHLQVGSSGYRETTVKVATGATDIVVTLVAPES